MQLVHTTAMVLIPPQEIWPPIQEVREVHDNYRRWMPHITLRYPFIPHSAFPNVKEKLQDTCRNIKPFTIELNRFGFFKQRRGNYIVWVGTNDETQLKKLHQNLMQTLQKEIENKNQFSYNPHLTMARIKEESTFLALKSQLEENWQKVEWRIDKVSLIWRSEPPDDIFRLAYNVALGEV